ncbi:TonB-dependent receptor domain-containing protein [Luteimonas sp. WGS1318]|uniref:TonB-dependent receptor domain-containing protein n=1 Tax=Luteimonas sp. WGS1318 TaxID=3366815 RepID=UPI00372D62F4
MLNGFGAGNNTYLQFDPSGNLVSYNPGIGFNQQSASGGDGWNLAEHTQLTSELERKTVNLNTRWNIVDGVDVFFEGLHYQADAVELVDQTPFQSTLFGGTSGALRVSATHPLLTQQARDTLTSLGITSFGLGRASRDLYNNASSSSTKLSRAVVGFDGSFELADRVFYWEAYSNYGRSESFNFGTGLNQQRFVNAINVTRNALGQLVCDPLARNATYLTPGSNGFAGGPVPVADPNCVPLDLFGEGRPSDAALRYVTYPTRARSLLEQQVYNANISSSLFDLWSGPLLYSLGYERRIERGSFEPDAALNAGLGRSVPITPLRGQYGTKEWFGELIIPLVDPSSNIPGLQKLELVGKYRNVENEVNGEFDTYTYGLQWKPFNDVEVRSNFTRSLRAPAITELFLPISSAFSQVPDSCDSRNISGGTKPDVRRQNCAAFLQFYGLPAGGFTSTAVGATIPITTGGNPSLANESADSYSYGFTWAPSWDALRGFVFSADYYNIDISGVIASLTTTNVAEACFDNENFNTSDIPNANFYCSLITRRADGQIDSVQTGYVNGEFTRLEAYSAEMRYGFDTDRLGRFDFGASAYFPTNYETSVTGIVVTDFTSTSNIQRSYQLDTRWGYNNFSVGLSAYHTPKTQYTNTQTVETRETLFLDKYWLVNGSASYRLNDKTQLRFAVTNLFDRDPPFPSTGAGTGYDILGRRYHLSMEWQY